MGPDWILGVRLIHEVAQRSLGVHVDSPCHDLSCRIFAIKANDAIAICFFEKFKFWVLGVHAKGVIISFQKISDHAGDEFEIKNHLAIIQGVSLKDEFNFASVPVGKSALIRVLGEEVAVFDLDHFANAIWHGWRM